MFHIWSKRYKSGTSPRKSAEKPFCPTTTRLPINRASNKPSLFFWQSRANCQILEVRGRVILKNGHLIWASSLCPSESRFAARRSLAADRPLSRLRRAWPGLLPSLERADPSDRSIDDRARLVESVKRGLFRCVRGYWQPWF